MREYKYIVDWENIECAIWEDSLICDIYGKQLLFTIFLVLSVIKGA